MLNKYPKIYTYLLVIILILILLGLLIFLAWRTVKMADSNSNLRQELITIEQGRQDSSLLKKVSQTQGDSFRILDRYFIDRGEEVLLIEELEHTANQAKVDYTLNNISSNKGASLDMNISGPFRNIYYFLKLLETSNYWISFDRLSLARSTTEGGMWSGSLLVFVPAPEK